MSICLGCVLLIEQIVYELMFVLIGEMKNENIFKIIFSFREGFMKAVQIFNHGFNEGFDRDLVVDLYDRAHDAEEQIAKRAASTRRVNDPESFSKMGQKGAMARHNKTHQEETMIAKKAASTRKEHDPESFRKMGQEGAKVRHNKTHQEESQIAKKAASTRKERDPEAFKKMGRMGGQARRLAS